MISVGVAAIAQPLATPSPIASLSNLQLAAPARSVATVRIVLPPPAAITWPTQPRAAPVSGVAQQPAAEPNTSSSEEAAPLVSVASKPPRPSLARPAHTAPRPIGPDEIVERLAEARTKDVAAYSEAVRTIAASRKPAPIPMVDEDSRAAVARMSGMAQLTGSGNHGLGAHQPSVEIAPVPTRPTQPPGLARVSLEVATEVDGNTAGKVTLIIRDTENISVRLADLLPILEPTIDPALFERLSSMHPGQSYATLNDLRAAGMSARFDDEDRLVLETH